MIKLKNITMPAIVNGELNIPLCSKTYVENDVLIVETNNVKYFFKEDGGVYKPTILIVYGIKVTKFSNQCAITSPHIFPWEDYQFRDSILLYKNKAYKNYREVECKKVNGGLYKIDGDYFNNDLTPISVLTLVKEEDGLHVVKAKPSENNIDELIKCGYTLSPFSILNTGMVYNLNKDVITFSNVIGSNSFIINA